MTVAFSVVNGSVFLFGSRFGSVRRSPNRAKKVFVCGLNLTFSRKEFHNRARKYTEESPQLKDLEFCRSASSMLKNFH